MDYDEIHQLLLSTRALIDGHLVRADGRHQTRILRPLKALQFPPYNRQLSFEIVRHFLELDIHVVIAPNIGSILPAVEVGRQLEARTMFMEERDGEMKLDRGFSIHEGERVLILVDTIESNDVLQPAIAEIKRATARHVGVGSIVDSRPIGKPSTVKDVSAIRLELELYDEADCPVCRAGTPATV